MFERYFKIPFVPGGRDWSGCDCYGLVRLVLQEEKGIFLPLFKDVCSSEEFNMIRNSFIEADTPADFDIVSMRPIGTGYFAHLGLYWHGYILHITESGVVMQRAARIPRLIKGYYRPRTF